MNKLSPLRLVLLFYGICFVFRGVEYLLLRTDQTIIGEAFIHKLLGILLLAVAIRLLHYSWEEIGFVANRFFRDTGLGLSLGIGAFGVAYATEYLMQSAAGNAPTLQFYVTSYTVLGNQGMNTGMLFILICIIGNLINVVMEEGIFRGLFMRVLKETYTFGKACIFSSLLFGIWHIAQPVRNLLDGQQSPMGAFMACLLLVSTSTLLAIQYSMLCRLTGSLWAGMAAHFVNNAGVNLLHIVTPTGADELQILRIAIAQTLSFVVVLVVFLLRKRRRVLPD